MLTYPGCMSRPRYWSTSDRAVAGLSVSELLVSAAGVGAIILAVRLTTGRVRHVLPTDPAALDRLLAEACPGLPARRWTLARDGGAALAFMVDGGAAMVLAFGAKHVIWRLPPGDGVPVAADYDAADDALIVTTGDATRPRVRFRLPADAEALRRIATRPMVSA